VHDARLALKRARALARVGSAWAARRAASFDRETRALLRALGAWRDADVQRETARRLGRKAPPELGAALRGLARDGDDARGLAHLVKVEGFRVALGKLQAMAETWPRAPRGGLVEGIARVIQRARRGWKRARGTKDARVRHRWRRREKERLHVAQLLVEAWPVGVSRRRRLNRRLDAVLGEEHDLLLLQRRLKSGVSGKARRSGSDHVGRRIGRVRRQADALGHRLHAGHA
jgi:CHAD domain-containing protein